MCNRNAKSEIYPDKIKCTCFICERTAKFQEKILFESGLINLYISMTKYLTFQYGNLSGDLFTFQKGNASAHKAWDHVALTCETPNFIAAALWPANSRDLNPIDYPIMGSCWSVYVAAVFMTMTSWTHAWSKSGNITTRYLSMKRSGSGIYVLELAFEHMEDILNTYFSYVWYLNRRTLQQSYVWVAYSGHLFWGDLTKPAITIAGVDGFYWNLVICLQLDIALLIQNADKVWHRLTKLCQGIQGVTFTWTQCI